MTRVRVTFEVDLDDAGAALRLRDAARAPKVQAWLRTLLEDATETLMGWISERSDPDPAFLAWCEAQGIDPGEPDPNPRPYRARVVSGSVTVLEGGRDG